MTTAPEVDPYCLALPTPATLVVPGHRVVAVHAHLNNQYADPVWSLAPLTDKPSATKTTILWSNCPPVFQDEIRLIAWTMINGQLRPTYVKERGNRFRSRLGGERTAETVRDWSHFATWLTKRDITSLASCNTTVLQEYALHLNEKYSRRDRVERILGALTRLWAFGELSARPTGIARPPWDELGVDDYLPAATSTGGENSVEPIAEQTMGPLLVWAIRMIDDFSADILAAWNEVQRLRDIARTSRATPEGRAALAAFLTPLLAADAPLPSSLNNGQPGLARHYIGGLTGASKNVIDQFVRKHDLIAAVHRRPGRCPLATPVTGRINGSPWRKEIDFSEGASLMRHLGTAAFVALSYLTGMRPDEVLGLRAGCCPDPAPGPDGTVGRHLIRGHEYKTATDEDGNHAPSGAEREVPWVAITPVVNAIRVLEQMVPAGHLLFDHQAHDLLASRAGTGSLKSDALRTRIEDFIVWANEEATTHGVIHEVIPPDPHGNIGMERFRRSLAWHIARRPNGLVALAIQYGHLRTTLVSEGYASRSRGGIHELVDMATVLAVADTVAELHDALEAGEGVSGPAARRAIRTAAQAPRFAGTTINAITARRLLENDSEMIHDNPQALLLCHYRREQALCHRDDVKDTPSLDHCVPGCGNIVRTDQHVARIRERADALDNRAASTPQPVGDRLRVNATKLRAIADHHDRTRVTLQEAS
ncbi:integrase [Streptomyces sp. NBC_01304]|uniref:integrase n=1 Tax=Streptomyces sp. NBC_01304 TaxID=2903818 RepID=UPI002E12D3AE|nr:integrase [Streptomyces sp. NBC_01304]WSJ89674.1 integrase [Streptomyces sp. NBC_01304]